MQNHPPTGTNESSLEIGPRKAPRGTHGRHRHISVGFVLLALFGALSGEAATFVVDSSLDDPDVAPGDGLCATSSNDKLRECTLTAAIEEAEASAGPDTILINDPGTYLVSRQFDITQPLTITGASASSVIIDGQNNVGVIFDVLIPPGSGPVPDMFSLSNVTVRGASSGGLADAAMIVRLRATAEVVNSVFIENNDGISIHCGSVRLTGSSVSSNLANGVDLEANSSGVVCPADSLSTLVVAQSTITKNMGDGIENECGQLTVTDSIIEGNARHGVVSFRQGSPKSGVPGTTDCQLPFETKIENSLINGNQMIGVRSDCGTLTIIGSTVGDNPGGGIVSQAGSFCPAPLGASASISSSNISSNGTLNSGRGVRNIDGTMTIEDTTIADNLGLSGGGILMERGDLTVRNSTISGNQADTFGGGIGNDSRGTGRSAIDLLNVTITGNTAGSGGGIGFDVGDGNPVRFSLGSSPTSLLAGLGSGETVTLQNTLIVDNEAVFGPSQGPDCNSVLLSNGYNLIGDPTGCGVSGGAPGDIIGVPDVTRVVDPVLADNGGPTRTHALLPNSPALNAGNPATPGTGGGACEADDQRGEPRVICDIGAYEEGLFCGDGITSAGEDCDLGADNGAPGACCSDLCEFLDSKTSCRDAVDPCDAEEFCTGDDEFCPFDEPALAGAPCDGKLDGECHDDDTCDGSGNCIDNFQPVGTLCGDPDSQGCNEPDECDGSGTCVDIVKAAGFDCRPAVSECDVLDECDGVSSSCPADVVAPKGDPCGANAGPCDADDFCDGVTTACVDRKSTAICRPSACADGACCDVAERCDGVANDCPTDVVLAAGLECRGSAGDCDDREVCDGSNALCPPDLKRTGICRPSACAGDPTCCDVAESCDGVTDFCPFDAFVASGTECRAIAGICDAAEMCTGADPLCPADRLVPPDTECGNLAFDDWAEDVEVDGGVAYVAARSAGLHVVEVTPDGPVDEGVYDPDTCLDGGQPVEFWLEDVEVDPLRGLAFLPAGPCGMQIVDVSNPMQPVLMGSFDTLGWVEDAEVMGNQVVLADFNGGLLVLDVSNPANPLLVGGIGFVDPAFGAAIDVDVRGTVAYVATTGGLRIVDLSNPEFPRLAGSYTTNPVTGPGEDVEVVDTGFGRLAFLSAWMDGVKVINVDQPRFPVVVSAIPSIAPQEAGSLEVTVAGTIAFVADGMPFLRIFDVSDPALPVPMGMFETDGFAWDVEVEDEIAYIAVGEDPFGARTGQLQIVNVASMGVPPNATLQTIPEPDLDLLFAIAIATTAALARRRSRYTSA